MTSGAWVRVAVCAKAWTEKSAVKKKSLASTSVSRDGHVVDQDRAAGTAAAHQHVAADRGHALEDVAQVAGDGDLLHRVADLAAFHPVAGGAARIVAGDEVDAVAEQLGDQQPGAHLAQHAAEIELPRADHEIVGAAGVAGGLHAELARRVAAQEIARE